MKAKEYTATVSGDKKKVAGSATAAPLPGGVVGFSFSYPVAGGPLSAAFGASMAMSGAFASCVYTAKKTFDFGFMFSPMPKVDVAVTGDSTGADSAVLGLKWACCAAVPFITGLGVKTSTKVLSLVAVKKFGKDATLVVSASSAYEKIAPKYGAQLTIG
jgi:hypothetical protein